MELPKQKLVVTSWFQEMANCAHSTIVIKNRKHQYLLVNDVFSNYFAVNRKAVIGEFDCVTGIHHGSTPFCDGSYSGFWSRDDDAMASGLPTFYLEPAIDYGDGIRRQLYTARYPLLDKNGNSSFLLTMAVDETNQVANSNQRISQLKFLEVLLELNSEISVVEDVNFRNELLSAPATDTLECYQRELPEKVSCSISSEIYTYKNCAVNDDACLNLSGAMDINELRYSLNNGNEQVYKRSDRSLDTYFDHPKSIAILLSDVADRNKTLKLLEREREQLARRYAIQSSLSAIVKELEHITEYIPLLQRIAEEIIVLLGADTTYLTIVDESQEFMEVVAVAGSSLSRLGFKIKLGEGIAGEAWRCGEIQVVDDYPKYANKIVGHDSFKQVCVLPIKVYGKVVGVIGVVYQSYSDFFLEKVVEFEEFAQQVTILVENAKLIESVRIELARNQVLYKLSDALYSSKDIQTILDYACRVVIDHCDTKLIQIFKTNSDGSIYLCAMASDCGSNNIQIPKQTSSNSADINVLLNPVLIQECLETQKTKYIPRFNSQTDTNDAVHQTRHLLGVGSSVCIPLIYDGVVWGALVAHRDNSKADYSPSDINLFGAIGNQASVALNRQKLLSEIEHQAYHDSLTGLPSRLKFDERLREAVKDGQSNNTKVAVLIIDLDGFKSINDNYGHAAGDNLLKVLSERLLHVFDNKGIVARMGGDEFAVVLTDIGFLQDIVEISELAISTLSQECMHEGVSLSVGASIGISIFPDDSDSAGSMLKNADFAMYQAKSKGKNCAQYFNSSMARRFQARVDNEIDLANAITNNELRLVFQPKVSVANQTVLGVEALLRWENETRGNIPPSEFIPIAEESGLIIPIGDWGLQEACRLLSLWHKMGFDELTVSVNVSAQQFSTGNFIDTVEQVLKSLDLDARFIDLELTESVMMIDIELSVKKLLKLKTLGVSVSIDDFGTGFSSLSYLEDLPLDNLKIDRSFIQRMEKSDPQLSLVNTIIGMAEIFGLGTVAEGVETEEQLQKVLALGCDCIQGYIFSKPVEAADLPGTIASIEQGFSQHKVAA